MIKRASLFAEPPAELKALLVRSASTDLSVAMAATKELAQALEQPLRKGNLFGNILEGIFEPLNLAPDAAPEFILDVVAPGVEKEHRAFAVPSQGRIPEKTAEGDYIMIQTYQVANAIDWPLEMARTTRWDVVGRMLELFQVGFVKKDNDDGFHVLITAGADRNIVVNDANAGAGRFTIRLLTNIQQAMRRNAGGNTASLFRGRLTDLYGSVEIFQDMRNWTIADVPTDVRQAAFNSEEGFIGELFGTRFHDLIELGSGQEYQNFYTDSAGLNGSLAPGDVELTVGLDLQRNDSFVNPVRQPLVVFEDPVLHREQRAGIYGWKRHGFASLDARRIILGSA